MGFGARKSTGDLASTSSENLKQGVDITEHLLRLDEVVSRFETDLQIGLKEHNVPSLRKKYGENELTPPKKVPGWLKFLRINFHGFSLLLWAGSVLCFVAYAIDKLHNGEDAGQDNFYLGIVLAVVVLLSSIFTYMQEARSSAIMESFKKMVPQYANVLRDGDLRSVPSRDLVPGDVVDVRKGDRLPADILILESKQFKVDNSSLTGEAKPVSKSNRNTRKLALEAQNLAFFSTNAVEGTCRGLVIRTGDKTAVGRIASLATQTGSGETPIHKEIQHFVRLISCVAVSLGVVFAVVAFFNGYRLIEAIIFLIGIIVANVPEGLLATVTVALTLTAKKMAKKNCLVKNIEAVETLGSTSVICSDKTGTLTQSRMTAVRAWFNFNLVKINPSEEDYGKGFDGNATGWEQLAFAAALCSTAKFMNDDKTAMLSIAKRKVDGDATESAILKMVEAIDGKVMQKRTENPQVAEIPFNSTNKYHVSIHFTKEGRNHLLMKGAPERVLQHCTRYFYNGKEHRIGENFRRQFDNVYEFLGSRGERVIGFCDNALPVDQYPKGFHFNTEEEDDLNFPLSDNCFLGLVALVDPPKATVTEAVSLCRSAGIRVMMVTGDHPLTAKAIAKQVGILSESSKTPEDLAKEEGIELCDVDMSKAKARVISGEELTGMDSIKLDEVLSTHPEIVFARTSPEQKLIIVESNQRLGSIVAVTGDGVNDSPALKKADIGIAMGVTGSDVSKEAADMILLDDNFASIVSGVEEGRLIFDNLKKSIAYTLTSNIPELMPFMAFILFNIPLPLGTITILFIDLGTDMIPAISLAYEKPERDIMERRPRDPRKDRLVNSRLIFMAYCLIGVLQAAAGFFIYFIIMAEHGFLPGRLFNLRQQWDNRDIEDLEDSYGQEWSYPQRKALEYTCHTGYFLAIVQMQWADLLIAKTRKVSLFEQGMGNCFLNFALVFETCLAIALIYIPGTEVALRLYALSPYYWLPALPFAVMLFIFDEVRKMLIRANPDGWVAKTTYY